MTGGPEVYRPDLSLKGKLRRRRVRLQHRRPFAASPGRPWVTFSFDDAPESVFTTGLPLLEARGVRATVFACLGLAGSTGVLGRLMDARQLREAAGRGHEIGCHTFSHRDLGQASGAETLAELEANAASFRDAGLTPASTFAYPYGDVCAAAKAVCGGRFSLSRGLHHGRVRRGADRAQAPATSMDGPGGEDAAYRALADVARSGGWLILFGHQVTPEPGEFAISPDALARLATMTQALGVEPVTAAEGTRRLAG